MKDTAKIDPTDESCAVATSPRLESSPLAPSVSSRSKRSCAAPRRVGIGRS